MRRSLLALLPLTASLAVTSAPVAATGEACDGRPATIVAVEGRPTRGTEGDDVIVGTDGPEVVDALGGNDVVCGLGGGDEIHGGAGDDRLFGGLSGRDENGVYQADTVVPGAGDDTIDLGLDPEALTDGPEDNGPGFDSISWAESPAGVTVDLVAGTAVGEGTDTIVLQPATKVVGSVHADTISGSDRDELFDTGPGDDVVTTVGGDDGVITGSGADRVDTGSGDDSVAIGRGADEVDTGPGADRIEVQRHAAGSTARTGAGRDSILMDGPADIDTGSGHDEWLVVLRPGGDRFAVAGGTGRDDLDVVTRGFADARVTWDNARGRVRTGTGLLGRTSGFERLTLAEGVRWTFVGADVGEHVRASYWASPVVLRGRGGADVLTGTPGDDVLDGGAGRDVLRGASGRDVCRAGEVLRGCESRG
ncbi:calcium-binding protein [Nocardioides sp.]|uniref:calcium-binding protein n=1 Tax=Nocardioides sp. TaxID=35761 RepID=UPI0035ADD1E2